MFPGIIEAIRNIFSAPEKWSEMKTRGKAKQTTHDFDDLRKIIKVSEYVEDDRQKASDDRLKVLQDNANTQVDQDVTRNTDNKRAYMLLTGVMLIGCILSVKGLKFFFGEFYASISLLMIIPVALTLAGVLVVGSIYLNNFANRFQTDKLFVFYQLKAAAYTMVLFIPAMNLLEGFDSDYRPVVMAMNVVGCFIDVVLHTSLVSMTNVFTTAEDYREAIKIMRIKDKELSAADQKFRAITDTFIKARTVFTNSAKQFIRSFKELEVKNVVAAANTLFLLDNFTIWMINNKVMQHAILPYHADKNGHPVVELKYFTPEEDTIRLGWDNLSIVKVDNTNIQSEETLNGQKQTTELLAGSETQQEAQPPVEITPQQAQESEQTDNLPPDYDGILDNVNPNDKVL